MQINEGLKLDIVISYDGFNEGWIGFRFELEATSYEREQDSLLNERSG